MPQERHSRPPGRLLPAATVVALLVVLVLGWPWPTVAGLINLSESREDVGCVQPEYVYGIAMLVIAALVLLTIVLGLWSSIRAVRRPSESRTYLRSVVALLALGAAFGVVAALNPEGRVEPCDAGRELRVARSA